MNRVKMLEVSKVRLDVYRELTRTWGEKAIELEKALDVAINTRLGTYTTMLLSDELAKCRSHYVDFLGKRDSLTKHIAELESDVPAKPTGSDHIESLKNAIHPNELEEEIKGE
ncbi:hypothetical protein Goe26_01920 [Bacillus phage vB_BsuM-Goe26]|nr:hypothetical protein Goe26_01920 [Bacillus phage vB_BsuM-Goe26]